MSWIHSFANEQQNKKNPIVYSNLHMIFDSDWLNTIYLFYLEFAEIFVIVNFAFAAYMQQIH